MCVMIFWYGLVAGVNQAAWTVWTNTLKMMN